MNFLDLYRKVKKLIPIPIKVFIKNIIKAPVRLVVNLWSDFQLRSGIQLKNATLSIVVLTHNALPYTKKCLKSIYKNTNHNFELIIIDNASTDGTQSWLKKIKKAKIIINTINNGVAQGRNQGIRLAKNDYIVFLDNDTEVKKNWDIKLLSGFRFKNVSIVGTSGGFIKSWHPLEYKSTFGTPTYKIVDYVCGWCFAFPKKLIDEIGYLDQNMGKFWHEDLEYCIRARNAGYKVVQIPNVGIKHYEHKAQKSKTITRLIPWKIKRFQQNADYIIKKFLPYKQITIYRTRDRSDISSVLNMITQNITCHLRQKGWKVNRKNWLPEHTKEFSFLLCNPFVIDYHDVKYTCAHQENDRPPKRWLNYFKENYNYNLCSSTHCIEALKKGGFQNDMLLPFFHGVDSTIFNPDKPINKELFPGIFKFLTVGASQPRKNTEGLVDIYCQTFTKKDKVILIIKDYDYGQRGWIQKLIAEKRRNIDNPKIVYIYAHWPRERLAELYRNVAEEGAYISMHHAECYGLPILEAACCGCRVGVTGWGGPKDFIDKDLFPFSPIPSQFHYYEGFYEKEVKPLWAQPEPESIINWMRTVYKEKPNKEQLKKRAYSLLDRYSWEKVTNILEEYFALVDEKRIGEFFNKSYWSGKDKSGYESYQECEVHENNASNLYTTFRLKGLKVLDLGCCFGYEVKHLNKMGANAFGCDISNYAVGNAYDKNRIYLADITNNLLYRKNSFDFVYSLSTFEHLPQDKILNTLENIQSIMKIGAKIFIAVSIPNDPEFFNDQSHRVGESETWWEKQVLSVFGNINKELARNFYEKSAEARKWNWHIFVAEKE